MYAIYYWGGVIFLAAADLVMILQVYAMWNQSKRILYVLLFIYVPQVIVSFIYTGAVDNPTTFHTSVTTDQINNFNSTICSISLGNGTLSQSIHLYDGILRLVLSVALLILAVIQTMKQSVDMYNATKQWQLNQYMQQLMRDGILYFLVCGLHHHDYTQLSGNKGHYYRILHKYTFFNSHNHHDTSVHHQRPRVV
ncbi:hypothetical protein OG21DRAFT_1317302 [Imleria badia]|nr:hypothetical protein OG21DRAFT_1317302 [Imleria badia]